MRQRTDMHKVQELVRLHRKGTRVREISRLLRISPNTERRWRYKLAAAGLLDGKVEHLPGIEELDRVLPQQKPRQQLSSLRSYEHRIRGLREQGASPKAIHDRLRLDEPGFAGSYWAVWRLCSRLNKSEPPKAEDVAIPVETDPGDVAQVDFGYAGMMVDPATDKLRRAWVFVMVLGHSRHMFAKCVFRQDAVTWQQLHVEAFAFFGGVPATIVPDNLKAAVVRAAFDLGTNPALNRSYRELARHFDFKIDPAPAYQPKKKGKVERQVQYVKRNALMTLAKGIDIRDANADLINWLTNIAGQRTHSLTRRRPLEMFEEHERSALQGLPPHQFIPMVWKRAKVHRDSHVAFDKRLYSVPWRHLGREAWVRASPTSVTIYVDNERVADHSRKDHGGRSTIEGHLPEHRRDLRHRNRDWWLQRADSIGPATKALVVEIFEDEDVLSPLRRVQAIVGHLSKFPSYRAERAAKRAQHFGIHDYRGVKDILKRALDLEPLPVEDLCTEHPTYRFARSVHEMLHSNLEKHNEYH
ncbi:MAG: IS21 family transposase [Gammaproteobacteria bacterium]|nr:IS21 family transposase [Gammaproteobacteria bacterium]